MASGPLGLGILPDLLPKAFKVSRVRVTKLGAGEYEVAGLPDRRDAHIQKDAPGRWVVDVFASDIDDPGQAHIFSEDYGSLKEALAAILPSKPRSKARRR